jgi:hypothetical protein
VGGSVRLTFEREPSYDRAARLGWDEHHTFVGEAPRENMDGENGCGLSGIFCRSVGSAWLEGGPVRLGYLGQLRRAEGIRLSRRVLREGFAACEATRRPDELPFDLTSIVADNQPARRLLERGLPGLPTYHPWTEMTTLLIPTPVRPGLLPEGIAAASHDRLPVIENLLAVHGRRHALAPRWELSDPDLGQRLPGLSATDFVLATEDVHGGPEPVGALALWDQRPVKQWRVRGYGGALRWLDRSRPVATPLLRLGRRLGLPLPAPPPVVGAVVPVAFAACRAAPDDRPGLLTRLVESLASLARRRGLDLLALGLPSGHSAVPVLRRRFRARAYASRLYLVTTPGDEAAVAAAEAVRNGGQAPGVEVAVL